MLVFVVDRGAREVHVVVACISSNAGKLVRVVYVRDDISLRTAMLSPLRLPSSWSHDVLFSSLPDGLSDSTGEFLSSCSAFSAWARSASIFFSMLSRWFSKAAAVCSPRWSSLNAFRAIRIYSRRFVAKPTWARSASECDPAPAPFCSFDIVGVMCEVVVVVV